MKRINTVLILAILVGIILGACKAQKNTPTLIIEQPSSTPQPTVTQTLMPTDTPQPTETFTAIPTHTNTPLPTNTLTPTSSPTITNTPYPTKQVVLDYNVSGWHGAFDLYLDYTASIVVLYSDGQMIIPGKPYLQKTLTTDEINQFLSQLENLGFYRLESNQQHDQTDQLYNFGDQYSRVYDGFTYCVLINGDNMRNLCACDPYREFLVPEMVNILNYLDNYQPSGMTQYYPDRILLDVQAGRNPDVSGLPEVAVPWPESLPSLETPDWKTMYFEGDAAREVFDLFEATWPFSVFTQNELEYTVYYEIVLPHEKVTQP